MGQAFMLMSVFRSSETGVVFIILFAVGMVAMGITGSTTLGFLLSAAVSIFFGMLIVTIVMHIARFVLVAVLSTAVRIKRLARKF
jgi:hypothetical protein